MATLNKVMLVGNLGRDPDLRYTSGQIAVANASLCTNEFYKNSRGEPESRPTWHKLTFWRKNAENVSKYCTKGSLIFVEGHLRANTWKDKSGAERTSIEVHVENVQFLSPQKRNDSAAPAPEDIEPELRDQEEPQDEDESPEGPM